MADTEKDIEASPLSSVIQQYQSQVAQGQKALDEHRARLMSLVDSRKSMPYDPKLMALAAGMLAPTKTGGFGESLGAGMKGYAQEAEQDFARQQAEAKMMYELESAAQQQKQKLFGQQIAMNVLNRGARQPVQAARPSAELTPLSQAAPSAAPKAAPAAANLSDPNFLNSLTNDELLALSEVPEAKGLVDTVLKLRDQARKENVKVKIGNDEREVTKADFERYQDLANKGDWAGLRQWHVKYGFPFEYVQDEKVPGGLRPMTMQEKTAAQEREKSRFGEQKEYSVRYKGQNVKMPLTPYQYDAYQQARQKGEGDVYLNELINEVAPRRAVPDRAGAPAEVPTGELPRTKAEEQIETSQETTRLQKRAEASEASREGLFQSGRVARNTITNSDQIIGLATNPKTKDIFGVFQNEKLISALGTIVSEGARVGNYTVSIPSVETAWRNAGATEDQIKAASVAGQALAQNELNFRKMFLAGQGSISNMEGAVIPRMGGSLSDSPAAAVAKAEIVKARAELESNAARALRAWERRPENARKNFSDFEDSPEYINLLNGYDSKLKGIMRVHFPGEAVNVAPNRPAGAPPARGRAAPAANQGGPEQAGNVDWNAVNRLQRRFGGQ
jgi:hypothetical protein